MRSRRARKRFFLRQWRNWLSLWQDLDWLLLLLPVSLTLLGATLISTQRQEVLTGYWQQHLILGSVGVLLTVFLSRWDYRQLLSWHWLVYGITNAALLAVMYIGSKAYGAQRWIPIAGFNVQPSEFAKVGMIICLAALLQAQPATNIWAIGRVFGITLVPWALVFIQPDLGTSLVFGIITLGMMYWAKARLGWIILMLAPLISAITLNLALTYPTFIAIGIAWLLIVAAIAVLHFSQRILAMVASIVINVSAAGLGSVIWNSVLKDYQKERLVLFLNPDLEPLGGGYHLIQSRIAIGAGGFWGRGLNQATQTNLNFIPEQHTDFIFSAGAEVFGFFGSILILVIFWLICFRLIRIALTTHDNFGSLLAVGVFSMLVFQIVINIGMNIGLAPVTGIPLPWLSYGRSALLTNFIAIGLVQSVAAHRHSR